MFKRSLLSVMVLVCTICILSLSPGLVNASPNSDEDHKFVLDAYEKMLNSKSYHTTMEIVGSASFQGKDFRLLLKGETDMHTKPLLSKSVSNITMSIAGKVEKITIDQYLEESDGKMTVYLKPGDKWVKQVLPIGGLLNDYKNYGKDIKKVTKISEEGDLAVFEVVVDLRLIKETLNRYFASMKVPPMMPSNLLDGLEGDLKYYLTIDKSTGTICQADIDMSEFISRFGESMANSKGVPAADQEIIRQVFHSMSVIGTVKYSRFDAVEKLVIPKEAKLVK